MRDGAWNGGVAFRAAILIFNRKYSTNLYGQTSRLVNGILAGIQCRCYGAGLASVACAEEERGFRVYFFLSNTKYTTTHQTSVLYQSKYQTTTTTRVEVASVTPSSATNSGASSCVPISSRPIYPPRKSQQAAGNICPPRERRDTTSIDYPILTQRSSNNGPGHEAQGR